MNSSGGVDLFTSIFHWDTSPPSASGVTEPASASCDEDGNDDIVIKITRERNIIIRMISE